MLGKQINKEKHEQDIFDMAGSGFESTKVTGQKFSCDVDLKQIKFR
jgi:hypothetical protein